MQGFIQLAKEHGRDFQLIADKLGVGKETIRGRAEKTLQNLRYGRIPMDQELLDKLTPKTYAEFQKKKNLKLA